MISFLVLFLISTCDSFKINSFNKPMVKKSWLSASLSEKPSEVLSNVGRMGGIGHDWTYNNFIENLNNNNIDGVSILSNQEGFAAIDSKHGETILPDNIHLIKTIPSVMDDLVVKLTNHKIDFDIFQIPDNTGNSLFNSAIQFLGFYLLGSFVINILLSFFRGNNNNLPNNSMNPFDFTKKSSLVDPSEVDVTFEDVAGCDEAKFELEEVVDFLKDPTKYTNAGAKIPKGVLLEGEPGTGKTLLARAVAGEAGVSFISASASEFIEMFVGVGASRVRNLFDTARKNSPCVIFIDEIDAIGRQRGAGLAGGNDEREQTLNQILTNLDGFEKSEGIIVLAATNRADILDSALLRPGRFDRKVQVPLPDIVGRKEILKVHLKDKKLSKEVNIDEICALTSGFSGADLANLANEAAILSVRVNSPDINKKHFLDAFEKITIGLPSKKEIRDNEVLELVSYHETGHALLVKIFDEFFDLRKVTINANQGGAGGYTLFTPKERYASYPTKKFMLANLIVALGGRAAEVVLYENKEPEDTDKIFSKYDNLEITTGASNDLKQAESIARRYVSMFGLSEDFCLSTNDISQPFLGKQLAMGGDKTSEYKKEKTDMMVNKLITEAYRTALKLIRLNEKEFNLLANKLMKGRNLDVLEFNKIDFNINIK